jgi:hypothetical protein
MINLLLPMTAAFVFCAAAVVLMWILHALAN